MRLNGLYEDGDSFRHHVDLKRYGINPTAALARRAGHADRPQLRIFPRPPHRRPRRSGRRRRAARAASRRTFFGDPDNSFAKADVNLATLAVEHRLRRGPDAAQPDAVRRLREILPEHLREQLQRRRRGLVALGRLQQPQRPPEPVQPDRPDLGKPPRRASTRPCCSGSRSAARSRATSATTASFAGRQSAFRSPTRRSMPNVIFAPIAERRQQPRQGDRRRRSTSRTRSAPPTGSRSSPGCASTASRSTSTTCARSAAASSAARDNLWSPRLGLVLKPTDDLSFYASYSRSYLPQSGDQFSSLDRRHRGAEARAVRQL